MHRTLALSDTHANKAVQNLILNAGETLEFSVLWICNKPWDHGGNYETTLAERWAIKHYTDRTGIKLANKTRGGELGGKGLGSAVVLVERREEFKKFKSIKACANFLECTSEKVKKQTKTRQPSTVGQFVFWTWNTIEEGPSNQIGLITSKMSLGSRFQTTVS